MRRMTYSEAITEGLRVVNRNWQLVLVRIALSVLSCLGFFFIVLIPLVIALLIIGVSPVLLSRIESSPDILLTQYSGIVIVAALLMLLYVLLVTTAGVYVFAAAAGTLARTVKEESRKFSMKVFFEEGGRLFLPALGYLTILGLIALGAVLFYMVTAAAVATAVTYAKAHSLTLSVFLSAFFSLVGIISGLLVLTGLFAMGAYGMAAIALTGSRPVATVTGTARYLLKNPSAFFLYLTLALFYAVLSTILVLTGLPLKTLPLVGVILSLPYQILVTALQGYAGFFILAVILVYYFNTGLPEERRGGNGPEGLTGTDPQREKVHSGD